MEDFDPLEPTGEKDRVSDRTTGGVQRFHAGLGYATVDPESLDASEQQPQQLLLDHMMGMEDSFVDDQDQGVDYGGDRDSSPAAGHGAAGYPRKFARVDTPLRVEPPASFNAPARPTEQTQEQQIKASAFSPAAFTNRKYEVPVSHGLAGADAPGGASTTSLGSIRQRQEPSIRTHSENQASYRTAMSDYHILAFSSQRSGRHEMEGLALYSAGVTMDSMGQYGKALENYKKFLAVCKSLKDPLIEGLCHNCMGVDYMFMACPPGSNMQEKVGGLPERAISALQKALDHHQSHLEVADDAGSGVAHSNIGLCYGLLGDYTKAAKHHQEALKVALKVQSASAQSVAVGNLGTLAVRQGDSQTGSACLEQHLQLVQQLGDYQGEITAWAKMAELAASEADCTRTMAGAEGNLRGVHPDNAVERSLKFFERAANLAKTHGEVSTLKRLHCDMGVVRGNATMDNYFRSLHAHASAAAVVTSSL